MKKEIVKKEPVDVLLVIKDFIGKLKLDNVKTTLDTKNGIASVVGTKDGICYTTTFTNYTHGVVKTVTQFSTNLSKNALQNQIKSLIGQGYKQQQVANMLNISQATVSKYLKK